LAQAACGARSSPKNLARSTAAPRSTAARPAMGIHVCNGARVLLLAALLSPADGSTLSHRFDLGRRSVPAPKSSSPTADTTEGSEIIVLLKPPTSGDGKSSKEAVEDLKFAVANEGMRPIPLKNFLSANGMNPKARLPPLKTITPGSGAMEPMPPIPVDMAAVEAAAPPAPPPPPAAAGDGMFAPQGFETTGPPAIVQQKYKGDLRQSLTTPVPPTPVPPTVAAPAAAPAGPPVPTTTPMMLIHPDAYAVNSVAPPVNLVRSDDGHILECTRGTCKCIKHVNGGVQEVDDPGCD